jgi:hypothetical protein
MGRLFSSFGSYLWPAVGAAFAASMLWGGVEHWRANRNADQVIEVKNACTVERANATAAALQQSETNAAITLARINEQKRVTDEAERQLTQARADAAIADAAAGRLSRRVAALVAAAREAASHPPAAGASPPAEDAIGLLAELQRRADEAAGIFARIADERGTAGQLCAAAYEALTPN